MKIAVSRLASNELFDARRGFQLLQSQVFLTFDRSYLWLSPFSRICAAITRRCLVFVAVKFVNGAVGFLPCAKASGMSSIDSAKMIASSDNFRRLLETRFIIKAISVR